MQIKTTILFLLILFSQKNYSQQLFPTCEEISENIICDYQELQGWTTRMNEETSNAGPNNECTGDNPHDRSWFAFVAPEGDYTMRFTLSNCSTPFSPIKGAQVTVYGSCDFTDIVYCSPLCTQGQREIPSDTLTAGETYYVLLDGCFGSVCDLQLLFLGSNIESYCFEDDNYIPMDTITDWYTAYGGLGSNGTYYYQYVKDTIINNTSYRKIQPDPFENNFQSRYIREDRQRRKVHEYSVFSESEGVLYDFSLKIGESYTVRNRTLTVTNIDSVDSAYGPLKRWRLDAPGPSIFVIEALGSEDLFLGNLASDPVFGLVCAFNQNEKVYGNDDCMTPPRWAPSSTFITATICAGESYTLGDQSYDISGTYVDTLPANNGLDSIVTLELAVSSSIYNLDENLCENESISINNVIYDINNPSGIEILNGSGVAGCDSIINVNLNFYANTITDIFTTICEGESYTFGPDVLTQTGEYSITLQGAQCDSIINLSLQVENHIIETHQQLVCEGDTVLIDNVEITSDGLYTFNYVSSTGCDSTLTVEVFFTPTITKTTEAKICPGEEYDFNGELFTKAGTFDILYTAISGCDSIERLVLDFLDVEDPECAVSTNEVPDFNTDIFPNPFSDNITILSEENITQLVIYNTHGAIVYLENNLNRKDISVDGTILHRGLYLLSLSSNNGRVVKKIMRE